MSHVVGLSLSAVDEEGAAVAPLAPIIQSEPPQLSRTLLALLATITSSPAVPL